MLFYKMGKKIIISAQFLFSIMLGSVVYTYFYPWLYNKVNHVTKRGPDLHDKIDLLNSVIMLSILYISIVLFGSIIIGGTIIGLMKYKK